MNRLVLENLFGGKARYFGDWMEKSIYKYVLRYTLKDQLSLLVLTLVNLPFIYISLEIPKIIINGAIGGQGAPYALFGMPMGQVGYLMALCFAFLAVIGLNGGIKYTINVYSGIVGERMLMRFRYELYQRILRFPLPHFKRTSQGEIIPMITSETEPLGGFIGESFTLPAFQGGLLLTYLFFIFQQDLFLGLAAIALYPPQLWLIPRLQRKVNALAKRRVREVRGLADRVGESISGINEIHAHDTSRMERAEISHRLGTIYVIRAELFKRKFFIKFLNNFLAQLTPFFFYSIGGYFVIQGDLSLGALVAVLAAYKDISPPWKELLKYYQTKEDIRVKYEQVIEQFQPENMFAEELQRPPEKVEPLSGDLMVSNLVYSEDGSIKPVDGANFTVGIRNKVSTVGATGSGKDEVSKLIARLLMPTAGRISLAGENIVTIPEGVLGRRQAYVSAAAHIFTGNVRDNLLYGLKHTPGASPSGDETPSKEFEERRRIAALTSNSLDDWDADWVDYEAAGAPDEDALYQRILEVLDVTGLERDVYQFGLNSRPGEETRESLAEHVLLARERLQRALEESGQSGLVDRFDSNAFNRSLSLAENILFGAPLKPEFEADRLAENPLILELLRETGLYDDFCRMGRRVAELMLELFADAPAGDPLFEQFSFVSAEDLSEFKIQVARAGEPDPSAWREEDRQNFLTLPFKLVAARHRGGMITDEIQSRVLDIRRRLHERLGEDNDSIGFRDERTVNPAVTLQDNILFGTLVYGQANAKDKL
ncbi:MAG: ATP-binding cassette domain-containing protein, partial [Proteobacteria bacterium]